MALGTAFTFRMPFGIPGDISRGVEQSTVEQQAYNASLPFPSYGVPGKMVSGLFVPLALVGDTVPYGFLVRPFPTTGLNASDPLGTAVPQTTGVANVLRRGYMMVQCNVGTPAFGGTVYMWYAASSGSHVVGGLEATSTPGSNVALTNCSWFGTTDSNGYAEIQFNI